MSDLRQELREYAELVTRIRMLSAVQPAEASGADDYAKKLVEDYSEIGRLGERCREILKGTLYPLLDQKEALEQAEVDALREFCDLLIEPASGEELDLFLLYEVSDRLLRELSLRNDLNGLAEQLNTHISVCYANVNRTSRITVSKELCSFYRDQGLLAAEKAKEMFYDRACFSALSNEGKRFLLRGMRFYSALYDTFFFTPETNRKRFQALLDAIQIGETSFYREAVRDYDWELHRCRCLEHMGQLTERGDRWGFTREECGEIWEWMQELRRMWESGSKRIHEILPEAHYRLILLRNAYFSGNTAREEYQRGLLELYEEFADDSYDMYGVQMNLLIPAEYLTVLKGQRISAREETVLQRFYHRVNDYVLGSVNMDAFNFMQEYLVGFLEEFIEIPGVMSYEEMGLACLAALHPPTYVHSLQVADIGRCLTEHLVIAHPELFLPAEDCGDIKKLTEVIPGIATHIYHCGLCHDFGKLAMIDSIFIYGRDFLGREIEIVRSHTLVGAKMLRGFSSTRAYADTAAQHHIWHSGEGGYPKTLGQPKLASELLEAADCIDAATDSIGRSYQKGKTLAEVAEEIRSGSGDRYSPYMKELLSDPLVLSDLSFLLEEGRRQRYRQTWLLLHGVRNRLA